MGDRRRRSEGRQAPRRSEGRQAPRRSEGRQAQDSGAEGVRRDETDAQPRWSKEGWQPRRAATLLEQPLERMRETKCLGRAMGSGDGTRDQEERRRETSA